MNIKKLTVEQIKEGFVKERYLYHCNFCSFTTDSGEVYPYNNHFYNAERRMELHIQEEHESVFHSLMELPKKSNGLTESQKNVMELMYKGLTDKEISRQLEVSESTIRHQRFVLREKAHQAKMFLALYDLLDTKKEVDSFLQIHNNEKQVDERYMATKKDEEKVLKDFFISTEPLKLNKMPRKEKYKLIILRLISQKFKLDYEYTENEVNEVIKQVTDDFVTVRRYLIDYGFLDRNKDG
ncbi:MAG: DUF2087 domain-containing protein [Coprobacillaceae bacterium]